jgi:hypothetical protein
VKAVRGRIGMVVSLHLHQYSPDASDEERRPDQVRCDLMDAAVEEAAGQSFCHAFMVQARHRLVNRALIYRGRER